VYALVDLDGDGDATGPDEAKPITAKMKCPNGIAYLDGNLYVAQMDAVKKIQNVDDWLKNPKSLYPVITNLIDSADDSLEGVPNTGWHGWRYMTANNATKKLYLAVGSPCNVPGNGEALSGGLADCADLSKHPLLGSIAEFGPAGGPFRVVRPADPPRLTPFPAP
jgi:glucose/arabinose dehydrogenase